MKVLVTGGCGYIGSHTCKTLALQGHEVMVYDNLSTGRREFAKWGEFAYGDVRDVQRLRQVVRAFRPDGVIHFAGYIAVGESVQNPGLYYENNVLGSLRLLEALRDEGVGYLVVSGTAAVYGLPAAIPMAETSPRAPINPYGRTKVAMEWMLEDFAAAHGLHWVSLRYFNAAGGDPDGETGEAHDPETHLIPNVLRAVDGVIPALRLFGDDYDTPDGTCIRDYIHVCDLASAHVLALDYLLRGGASLPMNLGTGQGISVREILQSAERVTGRSVPHIIAPRRSGDPARLVADAATARRVLRWQPQRTSIDLMLTDAWNWQRRRRGISDNGGRG